MQLLQQQAEFTKNVAKLINFIHDHNYLCTFGEAFRTQEQAKIYAEEGKGITDSLHCHRLAIDLNLFTSVGTYLDQTDSYKEFGDYWESLNIENRWGGHFKRGDGNHFEMNVKLVA